MVRKLIVWPCLRLIAGHVHLKFVWGVLNRTTRWGNLFFSKHGKWCIRSVKKDKPSFIIKMIWSLHYPGETFTMNKKNSGSWFLRRANGNKNLARRIPPPKNSRPHTCWHQFFHQHACSHLILQAKDAPVWNLDDAFQVSQKDFEKRAVDGEKKQQHLPSSDKYLQACRI